MNGSVLDWAAAVSAMALAVVFVVAAVAKFRSQTGTENDFRSLGLPEPQLLAKLVPVIEIITAVALIIIPGWGGVLAFAMLAAFTVTLAAVLRMGRTASCACFGGTSTSPVSARHIVRNSVLLVLALAAASFGGRIWELL